MVARVIAAVVARHQVWADIIMLSENGIADYRPCFRGDSFAATCGKVNAIRAVVFASQISMPCNIIDNFVAPIVPAALATHFSTKIDFHYLSLLQCRSRRANMSMTLYLKSIVLYISLYMMSTVLQA